MNIEELATTFADRRMKLTETMSGGALMVGTGIPMARQATPEELQVRERDHREYMVRNCREEIECFVQRYVFSALTTNPLGDCDPDHLIVIALAAVSALLEAGIVGNLRNAYAN